MTAPAIQVLAPGPEKGGAAVEQDRISQVLGIDKGSMDRFIRSLPFVMEMPQPERKMNSRPWWKAAGGMWTWHRE